MPPRRGRGGGSLGSRGGVNRREATPTQEQNSAPLHMTTRGASSQRGRLNPLTTTTRAVGGVDEDRNRPAKVSRRSQGDDVHSSPSVSDQAAADAVLADGNTTVENPALESPMTSVPSRSPSLLGEDLTQMDGVSPPNHGSPNAFGVSGQSTPWSNGSRQPSPVKAIKLTYSKPGSDTANTATAVNGKPAGNVDSDFHEPGGILKRLPGRRRAPHPRLDVEVDLRRQLELKVAYRAVVKALKPVLAEIADRTVRDLTADHGLHKQFPGYNDMMDTLDNALERKLAILKAESREEEDRLDRTYFAETMIAKSHHQLKLERWREYTVRQCKEQFLEVLEEARHEQDDDATECDIGVIPHLYHMDERTLEWSAIDEDELDEKSDAEEEWRKDSDARKKFVSRGRRPVLIEAAWEDLANRAQFLIQQKEHDESSLIVQPSGFAVYDWQQRAQTIGGLNLLLLTAAGDKVDADAQEAAERSLFHSATGLQALATAVETVTHKSSEVEKMATVSHQQRASTATPIAIPAMLSNNIAESGPSNTTPKSEKKPASSRKRRANNEPQHPPPMAPEMCPENYVFDPYRSGQYYHQRPPQYAATQSGQHSVSVEHQYPPPQPQTNWVPSYYGHTNTQGTGQLLPTLNQGIDFSQGVDSSVKSERRSSSETRPTEPRSIMHEEQRTDQIQPQGQILESHGTNMGPPFLLSKPFGKDGVLLRPTSFDALKPTIAQPKASVPSNEWPGFSSKAAAPPIHVRTPSFDAKFSQSNVYSQLAPSAVFSREIVRQARTSPQISSHRFELSDRRDSGSPSRLTREIGTTHGVNTQQLPYFQPAWGHSSTLQPSASSISPFQPPVQSHSRRSSTSIAPGSQIVPDSQRPLSTSSHKGTLSPSFRMASLPRDTWRSRPSTPGFSAYRPATNPSPSNAQPASAQPSSVQICQSFNDPFSAPKAAGQPNLASIAPSPQDIQARPGQAGHQRILPANTKSDRRGSGDEMSYIGGQSYPPIPSNYSPSMFQQSTQPRPGSSGEHNSNLKASSSALISNAIDARPTLPTSVQGPAGRGSRWREPGQLQWMHYVESPHRALQAAPQGASASPTPIGIPTIARYFDTANGARNSEETEKKLEAKGNQKEKSKPNETKWRHNIMGWAQ